MIDEPEVYGFMVRCIRASDRGLLDNALVRTLHSRMAMLSGVLAPDGDQVLLGVLADGMFGFLFATVESWQATRTPPARGAGRCDRDHRAARVRGGRRQAPPGALARRAVGRAATAALQQADRCRAPEPVRQEQWGDTSEVPTRPRLEADRHHGQVALDGTHDGGGDELGLVAHTEPALGRGDDPIVGQLAPRKRVCSRMAVLMTPGQMADTPTPRGRQSLRSDRENMSTAALVVL